MHLLLDVASITLILAGSALALSASVGLVRFRDTLSRLHAVTKPQTLGLVLTITGTILRVIGSEHLGAAERGDLGVMVLVVLFALVTTPVVAQRLGRIARKEELYDKTHLSRDDTHK